MQQDDGPECLLCAEKVTIIGIGTCNHRNFCHVCIIKLRTISKENKCPVCKVYHHISKDQQQLDQIILTDQLNAEFTDFNLKELSLFQTLKTTNLYYENLEVKNAVEGLNQLKCPISNCHHNPKQPIFENMINFKKHLKECHHRYLCDICLEHKTCVLSEQKLYNEYQLRQHKEKGDVDEDSNIVFIHPYCKFCAKSFYDEDKMMSHLHNAHINCNICSTDYKYTFYQDHSTYEKHLRMSHFMCEDAYCRENLVVFKTQPELEQHMFNTHYKDDARLKKIANQKNVSQFTGFYNNDITNKPKQFEQLKDTEGYDFSQQVWSFH